MHNRTVGTCSHCGGRVSVPTVYMSVVPPTPHCESCGARAASDYGPVIPMQPPRRPPWEKADGSVDVPEMIRRGALKL